MKKDNKVWHTTTKEHQNHGHFFVRNEKKLGNNLNMSKTQKVFCNTLLYSTE